MYAKENVLENLSSAALTCSPSTYHLRAISEETLFPLKLSDIKEVAKIVFKSSLPTSFGFIAGLFSSIICLSFVGNYGTPSELAGASNAITWSQVFYLGVMMTINIGFQVTASQLFGANKLKELGLLYRKTVCLLLMVSVPLLLFLSFADKILVSFGLDLDVAIQTGTFLRCLFPSLVSFVILDCTKMYLMAQNYFWIQSFIQIIAASFNFFWCYFFVDFLEMPLAGAAISKSITDITALTMLLFYIKYKHINEFNYPFWSWEYVEGWLPHLKKVVSIGGNNYINTLSLGISGFIVSSFNDEHVIGAHGIGLLFLTLIFSLPLGNSMTMQTYIGNAVGEGSKNKAQKVMFTAFVINFCYTLTNIIILVVGKEAIAYFFTNDKTTLDILMDIILLIALIHTADTFVEHLSSTMRTTGNEKELVMATAICNLFIGLACQWFFGVIMGYGYMAIWLSIGFGSSLLCTFLSLKIAKLNWEHLLKTIKQQMQKETETYIELKEG